MEQPVCNLCGARREWKLYRAPEALFVMCGNCSLIYMSPRRTREEYAKLYDEDYQKNRHEVSGYEDAIVRLEKKGSYAVKERHVKRYLLPFLGKGKRVFEIGTGWGTMLRVIQDLTGADVSGIEISKEAADVARRYYNLPVEHETFEAYAEHARKSAYDLVIMFHVLEHFHDPLSGLRKITELLAPEGLLFVAVPNAERPNEAPERFFQKHHMYYFSPATLEGLAAKAGLRTVSRWNTDFDIEFMFARGEATPRKPSPLSAFLRLKLYLALAWCYGALRQAIPEQWLRGAKQKVKQAL